VQNTPAYISAIKSAFLLITLDDENRVILDTFCLDRTNERLLRGAEVIKLRPKAFALLDQLVGHPGQLVTKEELRRTGATCVGAAQEVAGH
jgi:DNA-binding response OmpR family regulator